METLKSIIKTKFKTLSIITSALTFSLIILMIRVKLNKSFFYLFLVWNIFLAIIPYAITMYINTKSLKHYKLVLWFIIWLLFLPNAPYIITDFLHLRVANTHLLWLDIIVLLSFSLSGLVLFYLSLIDMQNILKKHFKSIPLNTVTFILIFLSAFGVYLGRYLRYNSWEIISQPQHLISDILVIFIAPYENIEVWLFTFGFGLFLYFVFFISTHYRVKN
ncbi:DUF1361 domain-containing protein [Winogradskyella sp. A3E31]|uniref:DUF1361 domain-containing protein n=1 Tax=Winogradskyella sp. A3E31 TaxID=3349637 RepID=UPI00398B6FD0